MRIALAVVWVVVGAGCGSGDDDGAGGPDGGGELTEARVGRYLMEWECTDNCDNNLVAASLGALQKLELLPPEPDCTAADGAWSTMWNDESQLGCATREGACAVMWVDSHTGDPRLCPIGDNSLGDRFVVDALEHGLVSIRVTASLLTDE